MKGRRRHPRITYPAGDRPRLRIDDRIYEVVDLSETGLCFTLHAVEAWRGADPAVRGDLAFADGSEVSLAGRVVRVSPDRVAVALTKGVPLSRILAEQTRLAPEAALEVGPESGA
jgi:hypothetical protein